MPKILTRAEALKMKARFIGPEEEADDEEREAQLLEQILAQLQEMSTKLAVEKEDDDGEETKLLRQMLTQLTQLCDCMQQMVSKAPPPTQVKFRVTQRDPDGRIKEIEVADR